MSLRISELTYNLFHPWSDRIPQRQRLNYYITFIALSILTAFLAPLFYYLFYYLFAACCSSTPTFPEEKRPKPPTPSLSADIEKVNVLLQDVKKTATLDKPPTNHSWQAYGEAHREKSIPFGYFVQALQSPPQQKPLVIYLIGDFTPQEKKIMALAADFIRAIHQTTVELNHEIYPLEALKGVTKRGQQYDAKSFANALAAFKKDKDAHIVAFTSYELFPVQSDLNFIFGYGNPKTGNGVFSKARLECQNSAIYLRRMIYLAAHEYGHIRPLSHCTEFACLMNGGMSVTDMDQNPILLCSEDVAKICWMNGITMPNYYSQLSDFFTQFSTTGSIKMDFSAEMSLIQQKLTLLS